MISELTAELGVTIGKGIRSELWKGLMKQVVGSAELGSWNFNVKVTTRLGMTTIRREFHKGSR
jgi:hypothetical protein